MNLVPSAILDARLPAIDIYRGIAILLVVLFHFPELLKIGFIGVDLFFVISGFLVSRSLLTALLSDEKIPWKTFFIKRFTKILPSYYFFILAGTVIARLFLLESHSEQVIAIHDLPKYLFFYLNYNLTFNWSFELAWSLCVEEHFYLLLVLIFLGISTVQIIQKKVVFLKYSIYGFILVSVALKFVGFKLGWDTYSPTHMRIDALFWGVLLSLQDLSGQDFKRHARVSALLGLVLVFGCTAYFYIVESNFFKQAVLHTLCPVGFYFLIRGTLHLKFERFRLMRVLAYFSYNWYLWHALVGFFVVQFLNLPMIVELCIYLVLSFVVAVIATRLIEEQFIKLRNKILHSHKR